MFTGLAAGFIEPIRWRIHYPGRGMNLILVMLVVRPESRLRLVLSGTCYPLILGALVALGSGGLDTNELPALGNFRKLSFVRNFRYDHRA